VDWERVDGHRQILYTMFDRDVTPPPNATAEQRARAQVFAHYWKADMKAAATAWEEAGYEPVFPRETAILALAYASLGSDRARELADRLGAFRPVERDAIEAVLAWKRGRLAEAAVLIERTFRQLRSSPWGFSHATEFLFGLAVELARREPSQAPRLYAALGRPFAVYAHEERRLAAAHAIAGQLGPAALVETLRPFEPNVPWNETFLVRRLRIYEAANDPLQARARRDLQEFRRQAQSSTM
jgi:hypothetical protein